MKKIVLMMLGLISCLTAIMAFMSRKNDNNDIIDVEPYSD